MAKTNKGFVELENSSDFAGTPLTSNHKKLASPKRKEKFKTNKNRKRRKMFQIDELDSPLTEIYQAGSINNKFELNNKFNSLTKILLNNSRSSISGFTQHFREVINLLSEPGKCYQLLQSYGVYFNLERTNSLKRKPNNHENFSIPWLNETELSKKYRRRNRVDQLEHRVQELNFGKEKWKIIAEKLSQREEMFYGELKSDRSVKVIIGINELVFKHYQLQKYPELQSIDNFIESLLNRMGFLGKSRSVFRDMVDFNVITSKIRKEGRASELACQKVLWDSYVRLLRPKYLPSSTKNVNYNYLIIESGMAIGLRHLKFLNLFRNIGAMQERIYNFIDSIITFSNKVCRLKNWTEVAMKTNLLILNRIVLLFRIFTPFDKKTIDELRKILIDVIKSLEFFWREVFTHRQNPDSENLESDFHGMAETKKFIIRVSNATRWGHSDQAIMLTSRGFLANWLLEFYPDSFRFLHQPKAVQKKERNKSSQFFNFLDDCSLADLIESKVSQVE